MQPIAQEALISSAEEAEREAETVAEIEAGEAAETDASFKQKQVFISHRCDVQPDEMIAAMLHADLKKLGCDVYLDKAQPLGERFEDAIEVSLNRADFVIALLSQHSNESDWVKFELSYALAQFKQHGRPTILPVGLGISLAELSMRLSAVVGGFNARSYTPGDYAEILADVKAAIGNEPTVRERPSIGIEGFQVGEFRKNITHAAGLDSPALLRAVELLRRDNLFWVVGDAGVRNHLARALAIKEHDLEVQSGRDKGRSIFEVTKSLSWSKVNNTLVDNCIIIFTDVQPSVLFDEESPGDALKSLMQLARRNLVIITASKESHEEIKQEMRDRDSEVGNHLSVDRGFYDERARMKIFEGLLNFSYQSGYVIHRQREWAHRLMEEPEERGIFRTIINRWSPADIERFVTGHLPQARRQGDILKLLQRSADLDNEIHTWFVALDDSTRCFVLALAMLSGLRKEQLWERYKLILQRLKKLDANLSLWPLGICRQRAAPYVTTEGQLDFVDERISTAIYREVGMNFREYLIELVPLIKEMSVPPGREQLMTKEAFAVRRRKAEEDRELRLALSRMVGRAGRQGMEDLTELLSYWGADPVLQVREAVARALEEAVEEKTGARHALSLLEKWCNDASNRSEALYRMWAAASALGSIAAATHGTDTCRDALHLLERLAIGTHANIRFYVSISLKKAARKLPLVEDERSVSVARLLELVARDDKASTKINVAEALNEARISNKSARDLILEWASGDDADLRWVAVCSLFLERRQKKEEMNREIAGFLAKDAQTTASVLVETLNHKYQKVPQLWQSFKQFILETDYATRQSLVSGLAGLSQASLEEKLSPLLRASANPLLSSLVIKIRLERWRRAFSNPQELITDILKGLQQESIKGEVYTSLLALQEPWPKGLRKEFVQAMVEGFGECRVSLDSLLVKLTTISPTVFEPLAVEVRCGGLRSLLSDPQTFIRVVTESLGQATVSGETCVALEILAQPEPDGNREEMLQALARAHSLNDAGVKLLLRQLLAAASGVLSRLVYDFNLRLLQGDLSVPEQFLSRVMEAMRDTQGRAEVLQALRQLSMPEPEGRRRELVQALGTARAKRPEEVDALLREPSWQSRAGLFSLSTQIKLFSFLCNLLSPAFASKIFALNG